MVKQKRNFWTDHNGQDDRGTACGISKSYWTMRNCGCVDKSYFQTQREGASGLTKHDNMHVCVSFGMHSLYVFVSVLDFHTYCIVKTFVKVCENV